MEEEARVVVECSSLDNLNLFLGVFAVAAASQLLHPTLAQNSALETSPNLFRKPQSVTRSLFLSFTSLLRSRTRVAASLESSLETLATVLRSRIRHSRSS